MKKFVKFDFSIYGVNSDELFVFNPCQNSRGHKYYTQPVITARKHR